MIDDIEKTEEITEQTQKPEENTAEVYLDALNSLKKTTVNKSEYDKMKAERDTLVKQMMEGTMPKGELVDEKPKRTKEELRRALASGELNNLEFMETALELNDVVSKEDGKDIFVANIRNSAPTREGIDASDQFKGVMKESIEECDGDSELFRNAYLRKTVDVMPGTMRRK